MRSADPSLPPENPTFKTFLDLLNDGAPEPAAIEGILSRLEAEGFSETALAMFRRGHFSSHAAPQWCTLRLGLEAAAAKARKLRLQQGQLDPGRRTYRICFEVRSPASELNPSALVHNLVRVLLEAGLPVAMGMEKTPRPMVTLGPPLPPGAEGLGEWADCVLREPPALPADEWPLRLTPLCPSGLKLLRAHLIPNHSSPILELAQRARWRWSCPEDLREASRPRLEAFLRASSFEIEKTGKVGGHKSLKRIDVRALFIDMEWVENALLFSTRIQPGMAPSPQKLLAGILGVDPAQIKGLSRLEVMLAEDPRLTEAHKYEPKLHNIYEDAVLLESDNPIRLIEEDDDDLLLER